MFQFTSQGGSHVLLKIKFYDIDNSVSVENRALVKFKDSMAYFPYPHK